MFLTQATWVTELNEAMTVTCSGSMHCNINR